MAVADAGDSSSRIVSSYTFYTQMRKLGKPARMHRPFSRALPPIERVAMGTSCSSFAPHLRVPLRLNQNDRHVFHVLLRIVAPSVRDLISVCSSSISRVLRCAFHVTRQAMLLQIWLVCCAWVGRGGATITTPITELVLPGLLGLWEVPVPSIKQWMVANSTWKFVVLG